MDDDEFLAAFEAASLPELHHRDHIRATWVALRRSGPAIGALRVAAGLRRFAAARGAATRYHETLTTFWIAAVARAMQGGDAASFAEFAAAHPALLDSRHALAFFRRETLASEVARVKWVAPDLDPCR